MSHTASIQIIIGLLTLAATTTDVAAQEPPEPSDEHRVLLQDVGEWKTSMQMFLPGQDEPIKSEGTEINKSICNGLFVQSAFKGEIVGTPFEGHSIMGYDSFKKKYTGVWVDNFGTSLYQMEGTYDAAKRTMTVIMAGLEPTTGEKLTLKTVTTYVDKNTKTFEMFGPDPTGQSKEMVQMMSLHGVPQK